MNTRKTTYEADYQPFPNEDGRNARQEHLEVPVFVHVLGIHPGARILEIGCGRGIALPAIRRLCHPSRLVGIDIDDSLLVEATANSTDIDVELIRADVRALPFPDETFDVVIDFGTCYHISHPAEAMSEIARVLAPRGLFCHETPLMQLLSHPVRWGGRSLPWDHIPQLLGGRRALLWSSRHRSGNACAMARSAARC
ncbi:MAG: class I SAM-dependent methyltransferase [Actinomycetota bacterium]|nr:class I SAM-dependent methyltransferase [Actinomycetota bacterium]